MSWHPSDLVGEQDLLDYEPNLRVLFGDGVSWQGKQTKVLEDWLLPVLRAEGLEPQRLRTRYTPSEVYGYTGSAYTDYTAAAQSSTDNDINLATVFASVSGDRLYVGSPAMFRGLYLRLLDDVSSATGTLTVKYWRGTWAALTIADGTKAVSGKTLSAGGSVTWTVPADWAVRPVNSSGLRYWAELSVSATPTGAKAGQVAVIRRSALCAPATLMTLALIYREAPAAQDGPWREKADYYEQRADAALQRALPLVGGEMDTDDPPDDVVDATEATQTTAEAGSGGWRLERG